MHADSKHWICLQICKCNTIGECEHPAGAHGYISCIKLSGKPFISMNRENRAISFDQNVFNCLVKTEYPFWSTSFLSAQNFKHNCNNYVKFTNSVILDLHFILDKIGYDRKDQGQVLPGCIFSTIRTESLDV